MVVILTAGVGDVPRWLGVIALIVQVVSFFVRHHSMSLQRAPISIVRSIRHVSLVRNWSRSRSAGELPHFSAFHPDERSGDAADMIIAEVRRDGDTLTFHCHSAGKRVEQIFGRSMQGQQVRDSVEPRLVAASRAIWHNCIAHKMPVYSTLEVRDRDMCPVTIEHIYLPYRLDTPDVGMVVAAFYAWSTEGRFAIEGLLSNLPDPLLFPPIIVDPSFSATALQSGGQVGSI